jgi:hypothetical protein
MPPGPLSRHRFTRGIRDSTGVLVLTPPIPFRFVVRTDTIVHEVAEGDSLFTLAGRYYTAIDPARACGLWWVIADFQPEPIHDTTCRLAVGSIIYVPSVRTVLEEIFNEARRGESA